MPKGQKGFQKGHPQFNSGRTQFKKGHNLNVGISLSQEHRLKIAEALKGRVPKSAWVKGCKISPATEFKKGENLAENNPNWLGDTVGYNALHAWVTRHKGKPKVCEFCGSKDKLEWANKSHEYKRDTDDWLSLCYYCHRKYDKESWGAIKVAFPFDRKRRQDET